MASYLLDSQSIHNVHFMNALKRYDIHLHLQMICFNMASTLSPLKNHNLECQHSVLSNVKLFGQFDIVVCAN
jgi:hypothetical protein